MNARDLSLPPPAAASPPRASGRVAVVLLHGLCSTPDELLSVHSGLRGAGHSTHALLIPGYSYDRTATRQRASRFETWVDQVEDCVRTLRQTHARVVLVGLSAGTSLALASVLRGCPVDGLVLLSTSLVYDGWAIPRHHVLLPLALYTPIGRLWRYRERPPYGVKNERVRAWIAHELAERQVSSAGAAVLGVDHLREHDRMNRHVRRRLPGMACPPVLALHARDDEVTSPANVALLQRHLSCPAFTSVLLDHSYHMITLDNDRREVVRHCLAFVHGIDQALATPAPRPAAAVL